MSCEDELHGMWWIPELNNPWYGTLRFHESEGLRLSLILGLEGDDMAEIFSVPKEPHNIVLGIGAEQPVTLTQVQQVAARRGGSGLIETEYVVEEAYHGDHFASASDLAFGKVQVQFTYLADWLAESKIYTRRREPRDEKRRLEVGYEEESAEWEQVEGGKLRISYVARQQVGYLDAHIEVTPSLVLLVDETHKLTIGQWYHRYLRPLENFLSLGVGRAVYVSRLDAFPATAQEGRPVRVVAPYLAMKRQDTSWLHSDKMLFVRPDLPGSLGETVNRWLFADTELEPVLNLYFSIGRSPRLYMEYQFSSTIQALEGYHRRRFPGRELPEDRHRARLQAILGAAPEEQRQWLKGKLAYSNEVNLAKRLRDLIGASGGVLAPWLPNSRKKSAFVKKVVDTRNTLTHYAPDATEHPLDGGKLFDLTEPLMLLMQALLLKELGFADEQMLRLFQRNQRYAWAVRRAQGLA